MLGAGCWLAGWLDGWDDFPSLRQGLQQLPMTVMLAWAKAKNENCCVFGTGTERFPWPVREGCADFPMEELGYDAIAVLVMLCQVFEVWTEREVDVSGINVFQVLNIPESAVNRRKCDQFNILQHEHKAPRPFIADAGIMIKRMDVLYEVPRGNYQWFPFTNPMDNRHETALAAHLNGTSLDLCGMWMDAAGRFVLLFEFLKPAKAGRFTKKCTLSNIELCCLRIGGSTDTGVFVPTHAMRRLAVGWAEQAYEGFHLGPYMVTRGLYAMAHGLHGA